MATGTGPRSLLSYRRGLLHWSTGVVAVGPHVEKNEQFPSA